MEKIVVKDIQFTSIDVSIVDRYNIRENENLENGFVSLVLNSNTDLIMRSLINNLTRGQLRNNIENNKIYIPTRFINKYFKVYSLPNLLFINPIDIDYDKGYSSSEMSYNQRAFGKLKSQNYSSFGQSGSMFGNYRNVEDIYNNSNSLFKSGTENKLRYLFLNKNNPQEPSLEYKADGFYHLMAEDSVFIIKFNNKKLSPEISIGRRIKNKTPDIKVIKKEDKYKLNILISEFDKEIIMDIITNIVTESLDIRRELLLVPFDRFLIEESVIDVIKISKMLTDDGFEILSRNLINLITEKRYGYVDKDKVVETPKELTEDTIKEIVNKFQYKTSEETIENFIKTYFYQDTTNKFKLKSEMTSIIFGREGIHNTIYCLPNMVDIGVPLYKISNIYGISSEEQKRLHIFFNNFICEICGLEYGLIDISLTNIKITEEVLTNLSKMNINFDNSLLTLEESNKEPEIKEEPSIQNTEVVKEILRSHKIDFWEIDKNNKIDKKHQFKLRFTFNDDTEFYLNWSKYYIKPKNTIIPKVVGSAKIKTLKSIFNSLAFIKDFEILEGTKK